MMTQPVELPVPAGVNFTDIWEGDTRNLYREIGTLILSLDPLRNPIVSAMCEQRRDGGIGAVEVAIDEDQMTEGMSADQARELAQMLIEAANQADVWAGRPAAPLTSVKATVLQAYNTYKQVPGNAGDYLRAALDSVSDAAEVLR